MAGTDAYGPTPVRTEANGDVVVFLADGTTPSQLAAIDTHGSLSSIIRDVSGNAVTTQASGIQRALDVGINVAGVQIDPRLAGQYNATLPTLTTGSFTAPQTDINGRLLTVGASDIFPATGTITAQDTGTTTTASGNQTFYTGTPTAGSFVSFTLSSNETVMLETTGTWSGTLQSEISVDGGTTWLSHSIHLIGSPLFISSFTANAVGSLNVAAKTNYRVRAISTWTGTATIKVVQSTNASTVYIANAIKLVDATTSITGTIKAASTAAAATDTSIVVALSPNSALPAGTNLLGSVNQGTSPWVVKDQADGPVTPGTAALFSMLMGGYYNGAALPTLTTGQQSALQLDATGALVIRHLTAASDTVVSNQGTAGTAAQGWFTKITDGTNTAAVKAASTAAAATDPAVVVALSPNSPVPAGTNLIGSANAYQAGAPNTNANPFFVALTNTVPGTPVQYYNATNNIALLATDSTSTYTITTSKTLSVKKVFVSASIRVRADFQISTNGTAFTTLFTMFTPASGGNAPFDFDEISIQDSGTGSQVRVVCTNEDVKVAGTYVTILGSEN